MSALTSNQVVHVFEEIKLLHSSYIDSNFRVLGLGEDVGYKSLCTIEFSIDSVILVRGRILVPRD